MIFWIGLPVIIFEFAILVLMQKSTKLSSECFIWLSYKYNIKKLLVKSTEYHSFSRLWLCRKYFSIIVTDFVFDICLL